MLPPLVRRLSRLAAELAVLIAFWWAGGWLAKAIGLPLPGGVVGLAALLLLFASGLLRPALAGRPAPACCWRRCCCSSSRR
ncbi:murein hydrolase exporter [Pseudomonas aeruginosa]|nr:murein hydrolase exporter [Pseudomonas aeruginosa]